MGLGSILARKAVKVGSKPTLSLDIPSKPFVSRQIDVPSMKVSDDIGEEPKLIANENEDAFKVLNLSDQDEKAWKDLNTVPESQRVKLLPEVEEAAENLYSRNITSEEFQAISKEKQPIVPLTEVPESPSFTDMAFSLTKQQVKKGFVGLNKNLKAGERVASRLDINAYNNYDKWIVSIHDGSKKSGAPVAYSKTALLDKVEFNSDPDIALDIARRKPLKSGGRMGKSTIARIFGDWVPHDPDKVRSLAEKYMNDPEWTQVGMNPYRASYFYDKSDGIPVVSADRVIQIGPLVLAKNVVKSSVTDPLFKVKSMENKPDITFAEGGMATQLPLLETDDPINRISLEGSNIPGGGRGSLTYKGDNFSVTPSGSFSSQSRKTQFEDGVILDESGKQVGVAIDGEIKLSEGVSLRGGLEKVFSRAQGDAYYDSQRIGGYNQKGKIDTQRLGATVGKFGVDYQQTTPDMGEQFKNISAVYKIKDTPNESLSVSGSTGTGRQPRFGLQYNKRFAEGGSVEQMNRLFQEGGMMQEGGTIDPVSGNEVPVGSMQEEVRDDIDAKLSEGEFVFPADVVRFIGLEKLMKIRDQAKQGLQRMDEMGQMGNAEEVGASANEMFEDDDNFESELDSVMSEVEAEENATQEFAFGGLAGENLAKAPKNPSIDTRYFKHADGRVMYIVFVNDKPSVKIPEGFEPMDGPVEQQVGKEAEEKAAAAISAEPGGGEGGPGPGLHPAVEAFLANETKEEQNARIGKINDVLTKTLPKIFVPPIFKVIQQILTPPSKGSIPAGSQPNIGDTSVGVDSLGTPGLGGGRGEGSGLAFGESAFGKGTPSGLTQAEIDIAIDPDTGGVPDSLGFVDSINGISLGGLDTSGGFDSGGGGTAAGGGGGGGGGIGDAVGATGSADAPWNKGGLVGKKKKKAAPKQTPKALAARR